MRCQPALSHFSRGKRPFAPTVCSSDGWESLAVPSGQRREDVKNKRLSRVCDVTVTIAGIMVGFTPHAPRSVGWCVTFH
ncbi:hypothetical protein [Okeania sp. KiyG1]|uniref:hypothetical protein n=1 Tax=Okeania sp. KiyG1 TaxID=2720165 RepID=UPI001921EDBD|nr:hypothetical protein [Okeania sp. KiyG1]